jgi:hypothetical protein
MDMALRRHNQTETGRFLSTDFSDFHRFFEKALGKGEAIILAGKQENAG